MGYRSLSVRNDTKRRFEDIDKMLEILCKNSKVESQLILKASLILMLYNVIESTICNLLTELFDTIIKKNKSIDKLPNRLQDTIYTYYLKIIDKDIKKLKEFRGCDNIKICNISYLDINKHFKLFSGNLDSKLIREISKKLGVDLPNNIDEPYLLFIKNTRNRLAHGEKKFSEACQDITLDEIKKMCRKVTIYLEEVTNTYEFFLESL